MSSEPHSDQARAAREAELRGREVPIIEPGHDFASVTEKISALVLTRKTTGKWWIGFGVGFLLLQLLMVAIANLLFRGIGVWGPNVPVGWGMDIINFVWWIGIGHAGTLISAILLLLRQEWRTSINRFAEAMTLFAVACAAFYPDLPHRPALARPSTGCSRTRTRWASGRTSGAR